MMSFLRRIPLPMSALALGLAGLGNLLQPYSPAARLACGALAALTIGLVALRIITDLSGVGQELATPPGLAVFPTFFMALMLLATYLKPFAPAVAMVLWAVALIAQLTVSATFIIRFVVRFNVAQVLPSWFLPFVGFVIGSVTSPAFSMEPVGRALLWGGVTGYVGIAGVIAYRLLRGGALPEPALATMMIVAAPPSLCLVGYLAVSDTKQPAVVYTLLAVAVLSLLLALSRLPAILRLRFYPSMAAVTFPLVISATALKASSAFLATSPSGSFIPGAMTMALDAFAAVMVTLVLFRFVAFLAFGARQAGHVAAEPARA